MDDTLDEIKFERSEEIEEMWIDKLAKTQLLVVKMKVEPPIRRGRKE